MTTTASGLQSLVLFRINDQRFALPLKSVERIIRAAAVTSVPETPPFVLGLINVNGQLVPVISLRRCLGLADHEILPEDQFVLARTSKMTMALVVDEVQGLSELDVAQTTVPRDVLPGGGTRVHCMIKIKGDIILIYDLDKLFNLEEQDRILASQDVILVGDGADIEAN